MGWLTAESPCPEGERLSENKVCNCLLMLVVALLLSGCKPSATPPSVDDHLDQLEPGSQPKEDSPWEMVEVPISGTGDYRLDKLAFNCEWALKQGIADEAKLNAALKDLRVDWLVGRRDKALKGAGEALGLTGPLDPFVEWKVLNAWKDGEGVTVALDYRLGDNAAPHLLPKPNPKQRFFALMHIPSDPELKPRVRRAFTFIEPFEGSANNQTEPRILDFNGDPFVLYYEEECGFWMSKKGAIRISPPNVLPSITDFQADPLAPDSVMFLRDFENPVVVRLKEDNVGEPLLTRGQTLINIDHPMSFAADLLRVARFNAKELLGIQPPWESLERPPMPEDISSWHPAIRFVPGWDDPVVIAGEGTLFVPDHVNKRWRDLNFFPPQADNESGYLGFATEWEVILVPAAGKARDLAVYRAKIEDADSQLN